jgi:hypothetical protein
MVKRLAALDADGLTARGVRRRSPNFVSYDLLTATSTMKHIVRGRS